MSTEFTQIIAAIKDANSIVITSHKGPDGDSIGSSLGLFHYLTKIGKEVSVCHPDVAPDFLRWLNGAEAIVAYEVAPDRVNTLLTKADLVFCLDYNVPERVGNEMLDVLLKTKAKKIMIDHHPFPADFCEITVSDIYCCSTSQLVFELLEQTVGIDVLDETIATPLYLGIMTDTGSFRFPSVTSRTHEVVATLIRKGVNHSNVHEHVYDNNTLNRLQLRGYAISEKFEKVNRFPIALISLSREDLQRFHYKKGDTEGLVNLALSVEGVKVAVFFMERDGEIKISFRSKGDCFVNELAMAHFSGGGHKYASGGVSKETLEETVSRFKSLIPMYFKGLDFNE
jgi:phosphoesterase RecJ-like protein